MTAPYWSDADVTLFLGDCVEVLAGMEPESVDAIVTDPPYGLEFMGKEWDGADGFRRSLNPADAERDSVFGRASRTGPEYRTRPSRIREPSARDQEPGAAHNGSTFLAARNVPEAYVAGNVYQQWCEQWAAECLRVLKPGGFMLAMGGSRTWHRLACAVEDAGFEIRDTITWHYGAGFPKSRNVSRDLLALPACSCGSTSLGTDCGGIVETVGPPSLVGAPVGAEPAAVPLAGQSADSAGGVRANVSPDAARTFADVRTGVKMGVGNGGPVVLRPTPVAASANGSEVAEVVSSIKAEPEPLRDQVVGDQPAGPRAIGAAAVAGDYLQGSGAPSGALVLPLASAPSGVALSGESPLVGNGHAGARAVDGLAGSIANGGAATLSATEGLHDLKCKACSGVRRHLVPAGLGTALKPATEFIVVARKPLAGTVARNVLEHGTGALNIDGCRVACADKTKFPAGYSKATGDAYAQDAYSKAWTSGEDQSPGSRWPANILLTHSANCDPLGTRTVRSDGHHPAARGPGGLSTNGHAGQDSLAERKSGTEVVEAWACAGGCPVAELDAQSGAVGAYAPVRGSEPSAVTDAVYGQFTRVPGAFHGDQGGASRFFPVFRYEAKANSAERPRGDDGTAHPTVKPVDLMAWLVRLVTPPGGLVLDCFAGSGTTAEACIVEGFRSVLIEKDPAYCELIRKRLTKPIQPAMFG